MTILLLCIGIAVPALVGWLLLVCVEARNPVLGRMERVAWSLALGPTLFFFVVMLAHWAGVVRLHLAGFCTVAAMLLVTLTLIAWRTGALHTALRAKGTPHASAPLPRAARLAVAILLLWTGIKLVAGGYNLLTVPTYWDDSFNNWNMRGKMFFLQEELVLQIPVGNGTIQNEAGVSSYPPTVPLMKTWLASLGGSWQEPLVNGVHIAWLLGLLATAYCLLRRHVSAMVALLGVYAIASLPLVLIHGTNPYADVFVAAHVLAAAGALFQSTVCSGAQRSSWIRLCGIAIGLLTFTKNEGMMLYAPILGMLLCYVSMRRQPTETRKAFGGAVLLAAMIAMPWLAFKWTHGLTFGNAKGISDIGIAFSPLAAQAIWFHLTRQPNWLLLPLLVPVTLLLAGRRNTNVLTMFVLLAFAVQCIIFTGTSLANEAILQTGISRGFLHIAPVAMVLCILLLSAEARRLRPSV